MSHEAGGDNRDTRGIAAFVSGLRYENVPAEVLALCSEWTGARASEVP